LALAAELLLEHSKRIVVLKLER